MPENFKDFFLKAKNQHNHNTRGNTNKTIIKTTINSTAYGLNSVPCRAASESNQMLKNLNTDNKSQIATNQKLKGTYN